jgi:hypothetical protein
MPPHEYVVEAKLQSTEERETFEGLRHACEHHPSSWRAFFRAYKSKNKYLVVGSSRYWYSQIGAARMMNRCDRNSELENIRGGQDARAIRNWSGSAYAWKSEYGLDCENLQRYCNLLVVGPGRAGEGVSIARYAAMVSREAVRDSQRSRRGNTVAPTIEDEIRQVLDGVEAVAGVSPSNSKRATDCGVEASLSGAWMQQKDMSAARVATDLRWFSTAPRMEVKRVIPLETPGEYLVQLNVPGLLSAPA